MFDERLLVGETLLFGETLSTFGRVTGWGGRDRTSEWRNQNPLPYRLATPQQALETAAGYRRFLVSTAGL